MTHTKTIAHHCLRLLPLQQKTNLLDCSVNFALLRYPTPRLTRASSWLPSCTTKSPNKAETPSNMRFFQAHLLCSLLLANCSSNTTLRLCADFGIVLPSETGSDIADLDGGSVAEITFPNPNNLTSFKVKVRTTLNSLVIFINRYSSNFSSLRQQRCSSQLLGLIHVKGS